MEALPLDIAGATLRSVERSRRDGVITQLRDERGERLSAMLAYPENAAGGLADPLALAVTDDLTVAEAQRRLRGSDHHLF